MAASVFWYSTYGIHTFPENGFPTKKGAFTQARPVVALIALSASFDWPPVRILQWFLGLCFFVGVSTFTVSY